MSTQKGNTQGALLMMGSMAAFTLNDALMKAVGGALPLSQAIVLRGVPTVLMVAALAWALGAWRPSMSRRDARLMALRNVTEIGAAYLYLTAIFNMPLANAVAILQVLPLAVTLAGAVFLGEAVGPRRWAAIGVGLLGVLLIVRPGAEGFSVYSLFVLAMVGLVTARELLSRGLSDEVPSLMVAFSNAVAVTVAFALVSVFVEWQPVTLGQGAMLGAASVLLIGAYFCAVAAVRTGALSVVAPFRYSGMLWGLLLGVLAFGERPDALTLLGAGLVVATGLYMLHRERQART